MKRALYIFAAVVALIIGITFGFQNNQNIELSYYFGLSWTAPLSLTLLVSFAIGVTAGYLASLKMVVRMQRQLVQARKEIRQAEQEVVNLRALPIKDVL